MNGSGFAVRRWVAVAVAAIAAEAVMSGSGKLKHPHDGAGTLSSPSLSRVLALLVALALLMLTPRLWRDAPMAGAQVVAGLLVLAGLNLLRGSRYAQVIVQVGLALLLVAVRAVLRARVVNGAAGEEQFHPHDLAAARAIVHGHGEDSISPFILRPDKALHLAGGGVLAYRTIGRTAVISGDPVAPDGAAHVVLESFLGLAAQHGWGVVAYGASARHLELYHSLGLRTLCVGEEAVVDPAGFTLEGRAVRKLRQSVHRLERHGWSVRAYEGREVDAALEAEIDAVEQTWRAKRRRILGFAMGMGAFDSGVGPSDLYLLARSPEGRLAAVMRFVWHRGKLSLDVMRRVGETPNGLNEALVCHALSIARRRSIPEVSLNYAGLGHLVRSGPRGHLWGRIATRVALALLSRHFQMQRLVRFNEKFAPVWRPRYLVYQSLATLPRSVVRVLQAEGYLGERRRPGLAGGSPGPRQSLRAGDQSGAHPDRPYGR